MLQTTIFEGLEVNSTNLLALCQPLPPVTRKTTTLAANLHKGIKVCTRTSFESKWGPTGECPERDLGRIFGGIFGKEILGRIFWWIFCWIFLSFSLRPPCKKNPQKNPHKNPHKNPNRKIRIEKSAPKNPHQKIRTKNPRQKSAHKNPHSTNKTPHTHTKSLCTKFRSAFIITSSSSRLNHDTRKGRQITHRGTLKYSFPSAANTNFLPLFVHHLHTFKRSPHGTEKNSFFKALARNSVQQRQAPNYFLKLFLQALRQYIVGHPQNRAFSLLAFEMGGSGSSEGDPFCTSTDVLCMSVSLSFPMRFLQGKRFWGGLA